MIAIFPEIINSAKQGDKERLAFLVRKYYGGANPAWPKLDLRLVFANIGIDIQVLSLKEEATLLVKDDTGSFTVTAILRAASRTKEDEGFLLAHMLGHFLLHVQPLLARGEWRTSGFRESSSPIKRYSNEISVQTKIDQEEAKERLADEFAAALIMPKAMVLRAKEKLANEQKMATAFGTTISCLKRRLDDLDGVSTPVNFSDAERKLQNETPEVKPVASAKPEKLLSEKPTDDGIRMPRSFAASTYGKTEKSTARDAEKPAPKAKSASKAEPLKPEQAKNKAESGLARLRQLAKKIDGSVES